MPVIAHDGIAFDRVSNSLVVNGTVVLPLGDSIDVLRITSAGNTPEVAGIEQPSEADRVLFVVNATAVSISFTAEDTFAGPAQRFGRAAALTLGAGAALMLWYDTAASRWRILSGEN